MSDDHVPRHAPSKDRKILLYAFLAGVGLIALLMLSAINYEGPGAREQRAAQADTEYRLMVRDFAQRCLQVETDGAHQRYVCRLLVRARPSGRHVVEITQILRGPGNILIYGRWSAVEPPMIIGRLTFFADRREYERPGALAAPGDEAYKELADIWLSQAREE